MKTNMIYSDYNQDTRVSTVTIANALGNFTGYATCHPDDNVSSFFGCNIAEYRATIKSLREEKRIVKFQIKALKEAYDMFCNTSDFNPNCNEARKVRKAIKIKENRFEDIINIIDSLQKVVDEAPDLRAKTIENMKKGKMN